MKIYVGGIVIFSFIVGILIGWKFKQPKIITKIKTKVDTVEIYTDKIKTIEMKYAVGDIVWYLDRNYDFEDGWITSWENDTIDKIQLRKHKLEYCFRFRWQDGELDWHTKEEKDLFPDSIDINIAKCQILERKIEALEQKRDEICK